jgi:hypothetical protein
MSKKNILLLLFYIVINTVYAQIAQPIRVEYPIDEEYQHKVFSFEKTKRAVASFMTHDKKNNLYYLNLDLLDQDLQIFKRNQLSFPEKFSEISSFPTEDNLNVLIYNTSDGEYELMTFNLDDLKYQTKKGVLEKKYNLIEMIVLNNKAFISGYHKKKHQLFIVDLMTGSQQTVSANDMTEEKIVYNDYEIVQTPTGKELAFKYSVCEKANCDHYVLRFDLDGKQIGNLFFIPQSDPEKSFQTVTLSKVENSYLVTGTFTTSKKNFSNGIYFSKFTESKADFIKFYNFVDIKSITGRLSEKQQDKLERKKEAKEENGDELYLNYNVTVHDIGKINDEYIFIGEFYYPTYRTEYYSSYVNGSYVTRSRRVFDGYQYSHAMIAAFDKAGNMLWDNSFEMWLNYKPYKVKQYIRSVYDGETVDLIYITGSSIKSTSFHKGQVVKSSNVDFIKTDDQNDEIKSTYSSNITWWYGRCYTSYGSQVIKNKENEAGKRKRDVFFINKITY